QGEAIMSASISIRRLSCLLLLCGTALPSVSGFSQELTAFVGARIIDGTDAAAIENGVLLVRAGRIEALGEPDVINIPVDATEVSLQGKTLMPGMVNAHGHAGDDTLNKLEVYARYGVTTVLSLGGEDASVLPLRDERATH